MNVKQVIILRLDIPMGFGKLVVQGSHASQKAAYLAEHELYSPQASGIPELPPNNDPSSTLTLWKTWFDAWFHTDWNEGGYKKIVLCVSSEAMLKEIVTKAFASYLPVFLVRDAGLTEVQSGTYTACAIGPCEDEYIDPLTQHLSLFNDKVAIIQTYLLHMFHKSKPTVIPKYKESLIECINLQSEQTYQHQLKYYLEKIYPPESKILSIPERNDPLAIAHKYLFEEIGLNIRPEFLTENTDTWVYQLNAIIPVATDQIVERKNVGKIMVSKLLKCVTYCTSPKTIDRILETEFGKKRIKK